MLLLPGVAALDPGDCDSASAHGSGPPKTEEEGGGLCVTATAAAAAAATGTGTATAALTLPLGVGEARRATEPGADPALMRTAEGWDWAEAVTSSTEGSRGGSPGWDAVVGDD